MANNVSDMSAFLNPHLCANTQRIIDDVVAPCVEDAALACGGCHLVQYCSKECQLQDRPHHRTTCKSAFLKGTWQPEWFAKGRKPAFVAGAGESGPPLAMFGPTKYLWGNMPALNILRIEDNEGEADAVNRDFNLLFAASGDLRNVIKTIVGLPEGYTGECVAVLNDMEFIIVARNTIMLLIALHLEPETAVPMIIHLWYSALLPSAITQTLETIILPLVQDVCAKIEDKPTGSLQAKTFGVDGRKLRIVLKKEDWTRLTDFCRIPKGLNADEAQAARRRIMLAPERKDYRDRAMLYLPKGVRQGEMHFRETGIFLPYGCSTEAFDVPNPTLFPSPWREWSLKDSSTLREGWLYSDYMKDAPAAKADEHGAIFFHVRALLLQFCGRLRASNISFQMFNVDARQLDDYVEDMKFDRIEISNICDHAFVGPVASLQVFHPLLKPKTQNPKATILFLFINAAAEMNYASNGNGNQAERKRGMQQLQKYMPMDSTMLALIHASKLSGEYHPELLLRTFSVDLFKDWDRYFDEYVKEMRIHEAAGMCGLKIKEKHILVHPWPYRVRSTSTQQEFDVLLASGTTGWERYMELENA